VNTEQRIGGYRILSPLGAGGMGEVWRAEDTKLGREVALKMLPAEFAGDPERMARFEREAKVLASLNHPNIATLFGLETVMSGTDADSDADADADAGTGADGNSKFIFHNSKLTASAVTFLVMELVEGEDLSNRIARGPIPVDEAVSLARQIAEALEAAHEQGIVHRDLKPANIKLKADGTVKVLDFGLAKAWETGSADASLSLSPTMTQHATAAGLILGTAAYMSPEQAAGTAADRRADIWSFGVVFWEMLTGHKLFEGETISHVLASVLKDEVGLDELPASTPPRLRDLIGRCLERKPRQRLQAIGDARIVLEEYERDPSLLTAVGASHEAGDATSSSRSSKLPWIVAALATALFAISTGVVLWTGAEGATKERRVLRANIPPPPESSFGLEAFAPGSVVISPDGSRLVFAVVGTDGQRVLWVRRLDELAARALPGTEGGSYPFWSPDSRHVAYFSGDGNLRKIDTNGGPPVTICTAPNGKGGSWNRDGQILFTPLHNSAIHIVPAAGGTPIPAISKPDTITSQRFPHWLPGGKFLYFARSVEGPEHDRVMVASIDDPDPGRELLAAPSNVVVASGYLLFIREETLMAQPFDPSAAALVGDAVPVAEDVMYMAAARFGAFSASENGVLVYNTGNVVMHSEVAWVDRSGEVTANLGTGDLFFDLRVSPDGRSAAIVELEASAGTSDIWIYNLQRGLRTRFTFDPNNDWYPVWSVDGSRIAFASSPNGNNEIWAKEVGGAGEAEPVFQDEDRQLFPQTWSPDGEWLVFERVGVDNNIDLFALPSGGGDPVALVASSFSESHATVSPDGRWMAFVSDESGTNHVYVTTFPEPARRWQISTDGGSFPRWSADGSELFFVNSSSGLVATEIDGSGSTLSVGSSSTLFQLNLVGVFRYPFDVAPDGSRFLVIRSASVASSDPIVVVLNWDVELEKAGK
jgi:serine/threonine protein kinase